MKKLSTATAHGIDKLQTHQLTIGLDLGDRSSYYCVLDEAGNIVLEEKVATTPKALDTRFAAMPRSRIALETGMHSPWVSRLLSGLGHETIVAHARNVRLIGESRRKDDRLDAQTLARLARIDPQLLKQVKGVGTLIALTYLLTLEDAHRFRKSRDVGCYLGLQPGRRNSGQSQPQLHISKQGDPYLRTLLVQGAQHILGPFGADSDLRRWGLKLAERGGRSGKKRAIIGVARKLAVLLHRLWISGEVYEPLRNSRQLVPAAA